MNKIKTSEKLLLAALGLILVIQLSLNIIAKSEFAESGILPNEIYNNLPVDNAQSDSVVIRIR